MKNICLLLTFIFSLTMITTSCTARISKKKESISKQFNSIWVVKNGPRRLLIIGNIPYLTHKQGREFFESDHPFSVSNFIPYIDFFSFSSHEMENVLLERKSVATNSCRYGDLFARSKYVKDFGWTKNATPLFSPIRIEDLYVQNELERKGFNKDQSIAFRLLSTAKDAGKGIVPAILVDEMCSELIFKSGVSESGHIKSYERYLHSIYEISKRYAGIYNDLIRAYRLGDLEEMNALKLEMYGKSTTDISNAIDRETDLLVDRSRIFLASQVVSALIVDWRNLSGVNGLIEKLENEGYTIEKPTKADFSYRSEFKILH